jgi:hypothetical protein
VLIWRRTVWGERDGYAATASLARYAESTELTNITAGDPVVDCR